MARVSDDFSGKLNLRWARHIAGKGFLERTDATLRFVNVGTSSSEYTNAQIDDYQGLPRRHFPWRPPLKLTVRARFSHPSGNDDTPLEALPRRCCEPAGWQTTLTYPLCARQSVALRGKRHHHAAGGWCREPGPTS